MPITITPPFKTNELPGQITYPFTDADGDAINVTGYTVTFRYYSTYSATHVTRNGVVVTGASGLVGYTPVAADLQNPGVYTAEFHATNGTNKYTSPPIRYVVQQHIGT